MCKMIAFVPPLHRGEKPESGQQELRTIRQFRGDGSSSVAASGAPVPGSGSARAGLPDGRFSRGLAGSSAGQAEASAGIPPRSFAHPDHREHHVSGHRAARLPEEAERSSRAGKPSAFFSPHLFFFFFFFGAVALRTLTDPAQKAWRELSAPLETVMKPTKRHTSYLKVQRGRVDESQSVSLNLPV